MVNLTEDIHSLTDFKRDTASFVKRMKKTHRPVVLTVNGKAELVVQDAASYQSLMEKMEAMEEAAGIQRGVADAAAGRVTSPEDFEKGFKPRLGQPRRTR